MSTDTKCKKFIVSNEKLETNVFKKCLTQVQLHWKQNLLNSTHVVHCMT